MRITTGMVLRNYNTNLGNASTNLDSARTKVITNRNFNSIAEDPASATKAFRLRRQLANNEDYQSNLEAVQARFDGVESSAMQITNALKKVNADILKGIDGSTSVDQRKSIALTLRETAKSIVLNANATYGDTFIFSGSNSKEVPFVLDDDGTLTYRGIDVDSTDPNDQTILENLSKEKVYLDLGFGLEEQGGKLVDDSAFNIAVPGINLLGYGTNDDGVSKNVVTLLNDMADALEQPTIPEARFKQMTDQFTQSRNNVIDFTTQLGTQSNFLENTKSRLEDDHISLNTKIVALENVDMADAITNYSWAQYAYNAALKVGSSILSPSFIDFMK